MNDERTYEEMLAEVEEIVTELQGDSLNLDEVVKKVERGFTVLSNLKERLAKIETKITDIKEAHPQE